MVASSSEEGHLVVNGMSFRSRSSGIANSAVVASVTPDDWNNEVLSEASPCAPVTIYGTCKYSLFKILEKFAEKNNLKEGKNGNSR